MFELHPIYKSVVKYKTDLLRFYELKNPHRYEMLCELWINVKEDCNHAANLFLYSFDCKMFF